MMTLLKFGLIMVVLLVAMGLLIDGLRTFILKVVEEDGYIKLTTKEKEERDTEKR